MIPFASQRGGGQDLATHLMNAADNTRIELFEVRGAIASDLHGALAEWAAVTKALTRCRQYLCSLSINPDPRQCRLTRAQYLDYIARAEDRLGLRGQPRAVVFHSKAGDDGQVREHCHVIWSRIDAGKGRAVPLSFFKDKLMAVTREFAKEHGLTLPAGYDRGEAAPRRDRQLTSYDCVKQQQTGISHKERMAAVTAAWHRSDSPAAFVAALEELGYILARGRNKSRLVLVDFYGHTTALTRLIDDPAVRARHVRAFLGADYRPENLPTVEDAQERAAQRRKAMEAFEEARSAESGLDASPQSANESRREALLVEALRLRRRQHDERMNLAAAHKRARLALKAEYIAAYKRIRRHRARQQPRGLAAFLARITGTTLVRRKLERYRDRRRYAAYLENRARMKREQQRDQTTLADRHVLQRADVERRERALDQVEKRQQRTLALKQLRERRKQINARHEHMPSIISWTPPSHMRSEPSALMRAHAEATAAEKTEGSTCELSSAFKKAAKDDKTGKSEGEGDVGTVQAAATAVPNRPEPRPPGLAEEFAEGAGTSATEGDDGEEGGGSDTGSAPGPRRKRRRRKRRKPTDQGQPAKASQDEDRKPDRRQDPKRRPRRRRRRDLDPDI